MIMLVWPDGRREDDWKSVDLSYLKGRINKTQ